MLPEARLRTEDCVSSAQVDGEIGFSANMPRVIVIVVAQEPGEAFRSKLCVSGGVIF